MSVDQVNSGQPTSMLPSGAPAGGYLRRLTVRSKPLLRNAFRIGVSVASTVVVNALLLLIAIPIGIHTGQLFWSIAITEIALFVACVVAAGVLVLRSHRGVGAGLVVGWAVGYVGLISIVVALILALVAILVVALIVYVLFWGLLAVLVS